MIYYTKESPFTAEVKAFYQGDAKKFFNFFYFSHSDHHATYKELLKDNKKRNALFDLAACYMAQLQYRKMIDTKRIVDQAFRYFRLSLQARQYAVATEAEISKLSEAYESTVVLVTGCQTAEVRKARVTGAYEAIKTLRVPAVSVVLSGAHPNVDVGGSVRSERYPIEPDEAGAMLIEFEYLEKTDKDRPATKISCFKESKASRTRENIANFFAAGNFDRSKRTHLLVSSSAFHLPRVADDLEDYLRNDNRGVERITLVAAEHYVLDQDEDPSRHQIYIKQMMFELFRIMFTQEIEDIDRLFERDISLKV